MGVAQADLAWMTQALELAAEAARCGEVPVGAVVVDLASNRLLGQGRNRVIEDCDPSAHAEIVALRAAGAARGNYRLPGAVLYVTVEPCTMCAGALVHARIERLVFGAPEPRAGAVRSRGRALDNPAHNHRVAVAGGVMEAECAAMMRAFFAQRRPSRKIEAHPARLVDQVHSG
ncbi:MAG: tRNA adenosine(34) deaminase TadA [Gammaproteobacteria bacterium]|nr:tRNA adenosine(34) deaminase TadA [Gammaproteobacteria bacterium]